MAKVKTSNRPMFSKRLQERIHSAKLQSKVVLEHRVALCESATKILTESRQAKVKARDLRSKLMEDMTAYQDMFLLEELSEKNISDLNQLLSDVEALLFAGGPVINRFLTKDLVILQMAEVFRDKWLNKIKSGEEVPEELETLWLTKMLKFHKVVSALKKVRPELEELSGQLASTPQATSFKAGFGAGRKSDVVSTQLLKRKLGTLLRGVEEINPDELADSLSKMGSQKIDELIDVLDQMESTEESLEKVGIGGGLWNKAKSVGKTLGGMLTGWGHGSPAPSPMGISAPQDDRPAASGLRRLFGRR